MEEGLDQVRHELPENESSGLLLSVEPLPSASAREVTHLDTSGGDDANNLGG